MLPFLLKSTACLAIFLAFYKLVLENESMHHFKRFYLLGALLASLIIPNIVFVEYVKVAQSATILNSVTDINDSPRAMVEATDTEWSDILWGIYLLGVVVLALRFFKNLGQIGYRIHKNPKLKQQSITRVLMGQPIPPHTFFSYIFLNKRQYEDRTIPKEVLLHEETHAKQKHSLDVILIELAQVVLWFNPLIYLLKNSIKLNHEFLADQAVVHISEDHTQYQNTLLSYLSHDSFETYQSTGIANAINYSSIKKRFTIMKTKTSKTSFILRSLLVLPLTVLLLSGFTQTRQIEIDQTSDQIMAQEENTSQSDLSTYNELAINNQQQSATREEMKEYNALAKKYNNMDPEHMTIKKSEVMRLKVIYGKMSEKQRADAEPFPNFPPPPPAPDAPKNVSDTKYASNQIKKVIDTQDPYDVVGNNNTKAPKPTKEVIEVNPNNPPLPPAPSVPPKPIEHIKKMVAKGASFTLNGKEISGKKAIEVVQKNKHINIDAREANGTKPIVKLSTDPIVIEN